MRVFTAADVGDKVPVIPLRMEPRPELTRFEQPVIAHGKVRYVGEPIVMVVADDPAIAEDAVGVIVIDIEPLPAVIARSASTDGNVFLFEEHATNVAINLTGVRGDADAVFRDADYTRRETFHAHRTPHCRWKRVACSLNGIVSGNA